MKKLDVEINHILERMKDLEPDSEEYSACNKNLKLLCEARSFKKAHVIEPDTLFKVGIGFIELVAVLVFESNNVITSKVFSSIFRGKVWY